MPSKCTDDPGNRGGTDIFCEYAYHEIMKKKCFSSQIQLKTVTYIDLITYPGHIAKYATWNLNPVLFNQK